MVAKKDENSSGSGRELDVAVSSELVSPAPEFEMDRWHSDNVDSILFERDEIATRYLDDDLRQIVSFDEYMAGLSEDDILNSKDWIGSGSTFLRGKDLDRLIQVKFMFVQWDFIRSQDYEGGWFVYCEVIDANNRRFAFTDGSKFGIRDQLAQVTVRTRRKNNLLAEYGLDHRSYDYPKEPEPGVQQIKVNVYSIA